LIIINVYVSLRSLSLPPLSLSLSLSASAIRIPLDELVVGSFARRQDGDFDIDLVDSDARAEAGVFDMPTVDRLLEMDSRSSRTIPGNRACRESE